MQRRMRGKPGHAPDFNDVFCRLHVEGCRYREIVRANDHGDGLVSVDGVRLREEGGSDCGPPERASSMKDYNGFSGSQRQRAQNWLNREWDAGRLARPSKCVACGQTGGVIDAHAEDYSDPFRAGVTDGFHLCRICHSMVHLRSTNPKAWSDYRAKVEAGGRAKILKENQRYPGGTSKFVTDDMFDWGSPPQRQALLEIEMSQDEAARRLAGEAQRQGAA